MGHGMFEQLNGMFGPLKETSVKQSSRSILNPVDHTSISSDDAVLYEIYIDDVDITSNTFPVAEAMATVNFASGGGPVWFTSTIGDTV